MKYIIREATPNDNSALLELFRTEIKGTISVSLERSPDFFSCNSVQFREGICIVVIESDSGAVVASTAIGASVLNLDGIKSKCYYLCDLRIHPDYQGKGILLHLVQYINQSGFVEPALPAYAIVFSDNESFLSMVPKGRSDKFRKRFDVPEFVKWREIITTILSTRSAWRKSNIAVPVKQATQQDIPAMNKFIRKQEINYSLLPDYDLSKLHEPFYKNLGIEDYYIAYHENEIIGIACLWDQTLYKQTIIRGYSKIIKWTRPFLNAINLLRGDIQLPSIGSRLKYSVVSSVIIDDKHPDAMNAILKAMLTNAKKAGKDYIMIGMDSKNPQIEKLQVFRRKRTVSGILFMIYFSESQRYQYSTDRIVHFEIARI